MNNPTLELQLALYVMFYDNITTFEGMSEGRKGAMVRDCTLEQIERMHGTLKWALANPGYPFSEVFPMLEYTNTQILAYIEVLILDYCEALETKKRLLGVKAPP